MSKTLLQLAHAALVAVVTALLVFTQGVDVSQFGTGVTAIIAGAVVGILVRALGALVNKLGPAPAE